MQLTVLDCEHDIKKSQTIREISIIILNQSIWPFEFKFRFPNPDVDWLNNDFGSQRTLRTSVYVFSNR